MLKIFHIHTILYLNFFCIFINLNWIIPSVLFYLVILITNIRYSATSIGEDEDNIIVFSGTVFREIVIWSPFRRSNGSNILHRLKKHEVKIYIKCTFIFVLLA